MVDAIIQYFLMKKQIHCLNILNLMTKTCETSVQRPRYAKKDYMADIMQTNKDNSPVSSELECVFHLE